MLSKKVKLDGNSHYFEEGDMGASCVLPSVASLTGRSVDTILKALAKPMEAR